MKIPFKCKQENKTIGHFDVIKPNVKLTPEALQSHFVPTEECYRIQNVGKSGYMSCPKCFGNVTIETEMNGQLTDLELIIGENISVG